MLKHMEATCRVLSVMLHSRYLSQSSMKKFCSLNLDDVGLVAFFQECGLSGTYFVVMRL